MSFGIIFPFFEKASRHPWTHKGAPKVQHWADPCNNVGWNQQQLPPLDIFDDSLIQLSLTGAT